MHLHRQHAACIALIAAGMLLLAPARAATTATAARLLVADKDSRVIFLLPESHVGTPAQQDRYFRDTIRPAFAAASALLLERGASARLSRDYEQRRCDAGDLDDPALDAGLNAALRAHPDPVLEPLMPVDGRLEQLGRFIRFEMLLQAWATRGYVRPAEGAAAGATETAGVVRTLPAQSGRLMAETPRPYRSVDDTATTFRAYCALAPAERSLLVRALLDDLTAPPQPQPQPQGEAGHGLAGIYRDIDTAYGASLAALQTALREPLAPGAGHGGDAPTAPHWTPEELVKQRFLITERNRTWIAQLPSVLATERLPFYAIGAAHFADGPYGPGLVTLLREAGYRVRLLDGRPALHKVLAHLPPSAGKTDGPAAPAPGPSLLAGRCVRIPGNYSCTWSDSTTLYQATLPSPSSPREVLTVCYRRHAEAGPLDQCVTALVPRAPQRAADLAAAPRAVPPTAAHDAGTVRPTESEPAPD